MNVIKFHNRNEQLDAVRSAVEAGVRAAISDMSQEEVRELVKAPFLELQADQEMRKAA